jgi:hypothetical protein
LKIFITILLLTAFCQSLLFADPPKGKKFHRDADILVVYPTNTLGISECNYTHVTSVMLAHDVMDSGCSHKKGIDYVCECLASKDNALIKAEFDKSNTIDTYRKLASSIQNDKFWATYEDLTYGEAYQRHILRLDEVDDKGNRKKDVGCTPDELSREVINQLKTHLIKEVTRVKSANGKDYLANLNSATRANNGDSKYISEDGVELVIKDPAKEFKSSVATKDLELQNKMSANFETKNDDCITYVEFMAQKSSPSAAFLKGLKASENKESFLTMPTTFKSNVDFERVAYLKSNPVIVKLLANDSNGKIKNIIISGLKKIADSAKNDDVEILEQYTEFMQNKIKPLLISQDVITSRAALCIQMAQNYAANFTATELPEFEPINENISAQVQACRIKEFNKTATKNVTHLNETTFAINDLFKVPDSVKPEDEFKALKEKVCKGFTEFRAQKCQNTKDLDECRHEFLDGNSNPETKKMAEYHHALEKMNVKVNMDKRDVTITNNMNNDSNQDKKFQRWFNRNIASQMTSSLVGSGDDKVEESPEILKTIKIPDRFVSSSTETTLANTVAEPTWANSSNLSSTEPTPVAPTMKNIALPSAMSGSLLPGNFASMAAAPEKIAETQKVQSVQPTVNTNTPGPVTDMTSSKSTDVQGLKDELTNLTKEIQQNQKVTQEKSVSTNTNKNNVPLNQDNYSGTSSGGFGTVSGPLMPINSGLGNSLAASAVRDDKSVSDKESFLNAKYGQEMKSNPTGRSPASESNDGMKLLVNNNTINALPENSKIVSSIPLSEKDFSSVLNDKDAFTKMIKEEMKKSKITPQEGAVVQFYSEVGERRLFVNAAWKDNQWVISPLNSKVQEQLARTYSLDVLKDEFK